MPRATLEFDLPEERFEFEAAAKSLNLVRALDDILLGLRDLSKHGDLTEEGQRLVEEIRSRAYEAVNDNDVQSLLT